MTRKQPRDLETFRLPMWMDDAACLRLPDPDIMFPVSGNANGYLKQLARAQAVCAPCPVVSECMVYAAKMRLRVGPYFAGVWAGRPADWYTGDQARRIVLAAAEVERLRRER
jgi:WhiB family transcriptional regulator, redox-sensing transcriptional regulator